MLNVILAAVLVSTPAAPGKSPPAPPTAEDVQALQDQVKRLQAIVDALQIQRNTLADQVALDNANIALSKAQAAPKTQGP